MAEHRCACGYSTEDAEELTDHFLEQFTSADNKGADGEVHYEEIDKLVSRVADSFAVIAA